VRSFASYLEIAIKAATAAGDLLRHDFHRPTGPRGDKDKAPADTEAEQIIRGILLGADANFGFLGEETGRVPGAPGAPVWVVDPNDGTRDYIKGRRGSSVSIALVWERRPVLGVVHAFNYPDDRGAMYSAVNGREGVFKNGAPVNSTPPSQLADLDIVLVSGGGDRATGANLQCTKPARVMAIPSIAHRLARVAAGEATATTSLYQPKSWDFAAGHCLVLAAGGAVLDQHGREPVYDDVGNGTAARLFAGSRAVALELSARDWDKAFRSERETSMPIVRLRKGGTVQDPALLSRAQGALLGHFAGSVLGTVWSGGPATQSAAGQMGPAGELAVACARSLIDHAADDQSLHQVYAEWSRSVPPFPDRAMEAAAQGARLADSLSPSALARVTPLTLWAHATDPSVLVAKVRSDISLTHGSPLAAETGMVLAVVLQALLKGDEAESAVEGGHSFARRSGLSREVIDAVVNSADSPGKPERGAGSSDALGVARAALFNARRATSFEGALESASLLGSGSDAFGALAGALAGARFGRDGIPAQSRNLVLSCRPLDGLSRHSRPPLYWATDALAMAEALLTSR
jgi:ADP-ribosyl-[dinitrogen reductase] hydrolase